MKNEEIILNARLDLMEQGIIKGTGEYITIQDEDGNEKTVEKPEELYTWAEWQLKGRQVRKRIPSIARIRIHKGSHMVNAFFWSKDQTDEIQRGMAR